MHWDPSKADHHGDGKAHDDELAEVPQPAQRCQGVWQQNEHSVK